jgi:hypothetical protein
MKFIEHHAIVWNGEDWKKPSGGKPKPVGDNPPFAAKNGFGHEEWNHSSRLSLGPWRGFYTNASGDFLDQISEGDSFSIIMTSKRPGGSQYLVGAAVNVMEMDASFRRHLKISDLVTDLLSKEDIWKRHASNPTRAQTLIKNHWSEHGLHNSLRWKCRSSDFFWADSWVPVNHRDLQTVSGHKLTWHSNHGQSL